MTGLADLRYEIVGSGLEETPEGLYWADVLRREAEAHLRALGCDEDDVMDLHELWGARRHAKRV